MRSNSFGFVNHQQRREADLFWEALTGTPRRRRARQPEWHEASADQPSEVYAEQPYEVYAEQPYEAYAEQPAAPPPQQQPYLPAGGRNFVPQQGTFVFRCQPATPLLVVAASFLPERTTNGTAALDAALTASGLDAGQRAGVERAGLLPIATEFDAPALTELFARLRWSAADIATWGHRRNNLLAPRLLIHIPGHFRELARRAPDAREAFVLECIGWLLMAQLRSVVAGAMRATVWVPPAPAFVTAVPNPIPPVSAEVRALLMRYLLIDTTMTAGQWNGRLMSWGTGLAGRQWQAEVSAPEPGRPFYASLATIPAHVSTATEQGAFTRAWDLRVADVDGRHTPHAAGATQVTLSGLLNAVELRTCVNSPHLPAGIIRRLTLPGLEFAYDYPAANRTVTSLPLMTTLHPVYTALFTAIRDLGWQDLLYQCGGGGCFRGTKHGVVVRVNVAGSPVRINPFDGPNATKVTQINTHGTADDRRKVINAARTARNLSNHGRGSAIDFNTFENDQGVTLRPLGSMDPRIIAIHEAFHFRFGACFRPTDPMHFDYCDAPCAPAAANAGTPGPVVDRRLLLPMRATERVLA
jgi:hypothetical protein